nr:glycosyltransferase family 2 protein [uncultured Flavobacterium sp.]
MGKLIDISIVSPVYNASLILPKLVQEIEKVMVEMGVTYEIILVDDRSPDNSWKIMKDLSVTNLNLKIFRLSRNFGQHPAIMAGLSKANGQWIVVMDCDLQDQPKEIKKLYNKACQGYDVVMAKRHYRKDGFFKKLSSKMFAMVFNYLSDTKLNHEVANFGIYKSKVIKEVLNLGDYIKSFPLFVYFLGFESVSIPVEHANREEGKSNYSFGKLLDLAFNSIIAYSNKPLKIIINIGLAISMISFLLGIYYAIKYLYGNVLVAGYTSLIISIFFLSGIIISVIGVLGVYLGKVFEQTKNRPSFVFDEN